MNILQNSEYSFYETEGIYGVPSTMLSFRFTTFGCEILRYQIFNRISKLPEEYKCINGILIKKTLEKELFKNRSGAFLIKYQNNHKYTKSKFYKVYFGDPIPNMLILYLRPDKQLFGDTYIGYMMCDSFHPINNSIPKTLQRLIVERYENQVWLEKSENFIEL